MFNTKFSGDIFFIFYETIQVIFASLWCMSSKHNASEISTNITWGQVSTCDQTVRRWFQKFRSGDQSLEIEEGRGRATSHVREMTQTFGVSIATISRHL